MDVTAHISRVHSLGTTMYRGFTHTLFNDMLYVYYKLATSEFGKDALAFHDLMYNHIKADRDTHGFVLSEIEELVAGKLYTIYKSKGYTGDLKDMLMAIESNIITADYHDVVLGIHPTKALDVFGWDFIFSNHDLKKKCHPHLFDAIAPDYAFNHEPTFSFNDLFPEGYEIYNDDGFPLTSFNTTEGSIFLEYSFDNRGTLDPIDICTFKGTTHDLIFRIRFEEIEFEPYNKAIFMVVERDNNTSLESIKGYMDLNTGILIYEKVVFSYKKNRMFIKGLNNEVYIDHVFSDVPLYLTLDVPFGDRLRRGIHTFTYYSRYSSKEELLYFLN